MDLPLLIFFYSLNTCYPWYSILCFRLSLPGPHRRSCDTFSDNVAEHWPRTIEEERGWTEIFSKGNSETHETFSLLSNYLILISAKSPLGVDSFVLEQDTSLLLCLSLPSSLTLKLPRLTISSYSIRTTSSRQVMRVKKNVNWVF